MNLIIGDQNSLLLVNRITYKIWPNCMGWNFCSQDQPDPYTAEKINKSHGKHKSNAKLQTSHQRTWNYGRGGSIIIEPILFLDKANLTRNNYLHTYNARHSCNFALSIHVQQSGRKKQSYIGWKIKYHIPERIRSLTIKTLQQEIKKWLIANHCTN